MMGAALDRQLARARRSSKPVVMAMIDFDHFKRVNDRFGHRNLICANVGRQGKFLIDTLFGPAYIKIP